MEPAIQYLSPLRPDFCTNSNRGRRWRLVVPFRFSVEGRIFDTPQDFYTDFASVPRIIWPIISPYDLGVGPVPHDFGYFTGWESKSYWDDVFMACMKKDGIILWKRESAYRSVKLLGQKTWDRYRLQNASHFVYQLPGATVRAIDNWKPREWMRETMGRPVLTRQELLWQARMSALTSA